MEKDSTAFVNTKHTRFSGATWYSSEQRQVLVGGAGGIGSWLSLLLSRANFECVIYDNDTVEVHNIGGQLYSTKNIGASKVQALKVVIENLSGTEPLIFNSWYGDKSMTHWYTFSCFDNMKARKVMFEKWVKSIEMWDALPERGIIPVFIDGRLSLEHMQIFCVTPDNIEKYREHLFDDSEVAPLLCSMKQTSHSAAMIASHMMAFFTNHLSNEAEPFSREVPFYWEYFIPLDLITIQNPVYDTTNKRENQ